MNKKIFSIVTSVVVLLAVLLSPMSATAKRPDMEDMIIKQGIKIEDKSLCYVGSKVGLGFGFLHSNKVSDIKVTSSNESVCKAELFQYPNGDHLIDVSYLRCGKATIYVSFKHKGKTYKSRARIKVVNYTNPFKSFKIGKKEYRSIFDTNNVRVSGKYADGYAVEKGKQAVRFKLKKGYSFIQGNYQTKNMKTPKYSDKKFNLSKMDYLHLICKDKQGYKTTIIWVNRKPVFNNHIK
ncbi:hypothetical protein [Butyrivibrio sp. JL13D10]|uniref:hypothetical protein n=1 Tax=Butyrivibrio sp. JL13D10 TaxID=3236815 RepID=UPI0038B5AFDC